jgi:hypothetical protein
LLLLIRGQVQHFGQMPQLVLGGWRLMMLHGLFALAGLLIGSSLRGWGRILRKHRRRNRKSDSENSNRSADSS